MPDRRASCGGLAARSIMPLLLVSIGLLFWFAPPASAQTATVSPDAPATSLERNPAPGSHTRDRLQTLPWLSADRSSPVLLKPRRGACPEFEDGFQHAAFAAEPHIHSPGPGANTACGGRTAVTVADTTHAFHSRAPPRPHSILC